MLVLSRKIGESIVLPNYNVNITVLGIRSNRIRIGIEAPAQVTVDRAELWKQKQEIASSDRQFIAVS